MMEDPSCTGFGLSSRGNPDWVRDTTGRVTYGFTGWGVESGHRLLPVKR